MGFYIRKSVSLGPIRLNFSKSGVGVSAGVKGARVGINARGRGYVHAGRYGIYYRQMLPDQTEPGENDATGAGVGWILILALVAAIIVFAIAAASRRDAPPVSIPAVLPSTLPAPKPNPTEYTVKPGDTLTAIARKVYGPGADWRPIFEVNRGTLRDPDRLQVGMKLVIPSMDKKK